MIYGRHFVLQIDHKPLLAIFDSKHGIPPYTANHLQRWALTMLLYYFRVEYISTDHFGHADIHLRLINAYVKPDEEHIIVSIEIETVICSIVCQSIDRLPVFVKTISAETSKYRTLQKVVEFVYKGWLSDAKALSGTLEVQQLFARRDSLYFAQNVLMYGERIVIPKKLQQKVLE
ncbi:uncharacterized protein LOC131679940 [Topomyia yanbarensis]|uniref:uncharacterized protein LOC131679940 n=1 Tax=Topomyia yanbarensis TaxID=2498891 RepID=UPI00273A83DF|nr:uncharacterized protein LOC131679940 [Topomyia yanbarensis]